MRWIALQASIRPDAASPLIDAAAAQQALACMALGYTPRVALVDEAVLMEVSGSLRLFGGLARLAQQMAQQASQFFEKNKVMAHMEQAQGATSLIALGRLRQCRAQPEAAAARVADLPMHTLTAARTHLDVLERVGCRSWDDLLRLPRAGVARRFGAPLLQALDRARGHAPDVYDWQVLPESFDQTLELDALVTHAPALMAGAQRLLVPLQAWLLGRQRGLSALKLVWQFDKRRDVAPSGELVIRTAQPAQDLRHLARLMAEQLGQQRLPAPVHSLRLQSLETEALSDSAAATGSLLMAARQQGGSALELVERLSARLGPAQVQTWKARADHRPEQMQCWVSAQNTIKSIANIVGNERATGPNNLKNEVRTEALYPTWLLPEPIKLASVGNSPVYQGRLVRLAGPQRLEATGWLLASDADGQRGKPPAIRDYFIYRSLQAGLLWIYTERLAVATPPSAPEPPRAWYLHGFFA
ncbi:MAG: DNA polymerase Y family protein [Polaromonas sp.]|nr:DNA polymerase Y family protein [Polaromonas sp.]